jgi:hypothetical protein
MTIAGIIKWFAWYPVKTRDEGWIWWRDVVLLDIRYTNGFMYYEGFWIDPQKALEWGRYNNWEEKQCVPKTS